MPNILLKIQNLPNSSVRFVNGLPSSSCVGSYVSLTAVVWRQTFCGAEVTDYKNGFDITAEPSCHFLLPLSKEWSVAAISCEVYAVSALPVTFQQMPTGTHKRRGAVRHSCKQFNIWESNNAVERLQPTQLEEFKAILNTRLVDRDRWVRMAANLRHTTVIYQPKTLIWGEADKSLFLLYLKRTEKTGGWNLPPPRIINNLKI